MPYKDKKQRIENTKKWFKEHPNYSHEWLKKHPNYFHKWLKKHPNYLKEQREKFKKNHPYYFKNYWRKNYKENYEKRKNIGAEQARWIIKEAIRKDLLISLTKNYIKCSDCDKRATQYDHRDYNKPLEIEPVCGKCNKRRGKAISLKKEVADVSKC